MLETYFPDRIEKAQAENIENIAYWNYITQCGFLFRNFELYLQFEWTFRYTCRLKHFSV